jgi:hypothetical protein
LISQGTLHATGLLRAFGRKAHPRLDAFMTAHIYKLVPDDLVKRLALETLVQQCDEPIRQLVARYDLAGRNFMSIGAGGGFEEVVLLKHGLRRAYLFDIDEHNTLTQILPTLEKPDLADAPIHYTLDDFTKTQPNSAELEPIGLLYFSGFTPDEKHRLDTMQAHHKRATEGTATSKDPDWPANTAPFHGIVIRALNHYLVDGGVVIIQSYYGGLDPMSNPGYIKAWKDFLAQHGIQLLEAYCFTASAAVTLWVGIKATSEAGRRAVEAFSKDQANREALTLFHGRAQLEDKSIIRFVPAPPWSYAMRPVKGRLKRAVMRLVGR